MALEVLRDRVVTAPDGELDEERQPHHAEAGADRVIARSIEQIVPADDRYRLDDRGSDARWPEMLYLAAQLPPAIFGACVWYSDQIMDRSEQRVRRRERRRQGPEALQRAGSDTDR